MSPLRASIFPSSSDSVARASASGSAETAPEDVLDCPSFSSGTSCPARVQCGPKQELGSVGGAMLLAAKVLRRSREAVSQGADSCSSALTWCNPGGFASDLRGSARESREYTSKLSVGTKSLLSLCFSLAAVHPGPFDRRRRVQLGQERTEPSSCYGGQQFGLGEAPGCEGAAGVHVWLGVALATVEKAPASGSEGSWR